MGEEAKMTMILCSGLEPIEQDKVERLDGLISDRLIQAGLVARICQGRGANDERFLEFTGPAGIVAKVRAADFLSASDQAAVAAIALMES